MNHLADLPLVQALGWTLVHSLWQGAGVGLLAWAGLRLLRRRSPQARYLLACGALAALPAMALATLLLVWPAQAGPAYLEAPGPGGFREGLEPLLPYASAFWTAGVSLLGLRLLGGWWWLQRLRWLGSKPASEAWASRLRALAERLGVRGSVALLESWAADAPMVIGWLRPVILVPAAALAGLSPEGLEAVLAHELAHVRRHDYLVNLLQSLVEALFFHHPAAWWLSGQIRAEREHCCDDAAVDLCGDPLLYARALADLEDLRHSLEPQTGLAVAANGGILMNRIRRLILPTLPPSPAGRAGFMALLAVTTLGAATGLGLRQETAAPPPPAPKAAPAPEAPAPKAPRRSLRAERQADLDAKARAIQAKAEAFAKEVEASRLSGKASANLARLQEELQGLAREMAAQAKEMAKIRVHVPRIEVEERDFDFPDLRGLEALGGGEDGRPIILKRHERPSATELQELKEELAQLKARLDRLEPPAPPRAPAPPQRPVAPVPSAPPSR